MAYKGLGVPSASLLFHIPNEGAGGNPIRGAMLKRQGVVNGVPDYFLAVARKGFNGLFIELKKDTGRASKEQDKIIVELTCQGYLACVCYSFEEAVNLVEGYLKSK
jgi:hypothetical protein